MDRGIFVSMVGANAAQKKLAEVSNNLANIATPGFKEAYHSGIARYVVTDGNMGTTRVVPDNIEPARKMTVGVISASLPTHVAVVDEGVGVKMQRPDGSFYATRNGSFELRNGNYYLGSDIVLDNNDQPLTESNPNDIQTVQLGTWTDAGYVVGNQVPAKIKWGFIEQSTTNASENLLNMISASRSWDLQMQFIKRFDENEQKANSILGN